MQGNSLTVHFDWTPHGTVEVAAHTIDFRKVSNVPGLYRIDLDDSHTYIGEAVNLHRRFNGYRSPGGSTETLKPRTNRRIQRRILEALGAGRDVPVWISTEARVTVGGDTLPLPLNDKTHRLLVEATAIVLAERDGYTLENLHRG